MFSPSGFPDGAVLYDLITHIPPPSHVALSPFDLYREPLAVIALADGRELDEATFSKRISTNGTGLTMVEKNIRALYQELEDLRDAFPKALVHQVLVFDYTAPPDTEIPMPEGISPLLPSDETQPTMLNTTMCRITSLLLEELTSLAKKFEAMSNIESPGHYSMARHINGASWAGEDGPNGMARRNSQHSVNQPNGRSSSAMGAMEKNHARMSMPLVPSQHSATASSSSTPGRPSTPVKGNQSVPPVGLDGTSTGASTPEQGPSRPSTAEGTRDTSQDRVSVQGFGPGGANDRKRIKGKGRVAVVLGSMYLQAGHWADALRELSEGAAAARSLNDHIWHGKALELIVVTLCLLGWSDLEFQIPTVCMPAQDKPSSASGPKSDEAANAQQPKHLRDLELILPELLERIVGLYSRVSAESLPLLPLSEATIRFCKIMSAVHFQNGRLDRQSLDMIVSGKLPETELTTSPRLTITPSRQQIFGLLLRAFPSSATELLTTSDRIALLSGIASVLGPLGLHRKKAMVVRELVSVLIGGLIEARTRGAAEAGVHPAAGLVSLTSGQEQNNSAVALDLGEGDIEQGIEAFLQLLCKSYGVVGFNESRKQESTPPDEIDDSNEAVIARIRRQCDTRFFGFPSIKLNILRACINFSEALPDFNGVLKFSSDLLRTASSGVAPGPRREDASAIVHRDEQARLVTNITRTSALTQRIGLSQLSAEYWDEFLVRGIKFEPLSSSRTPIPHARSALPGATDSRASQDVNPFIYNPFLKEPDEAVADQTLVAAEMATFKVTLQNTFDIEVEIESIRLDTEGVEFEAFPTSTTIGPYRTQVLKLKGLPKDKGAIRVTGTIVKVRGCRERRFPVFSKPWVPVAQEMIKTKGMIALEASPAPAKTAHVSLEAEYVGLNVIQSQPTVAVKSISLPQSSVMILEGERQIFSVTLQNESQTPVDFMLFSFKDSTQGPLQTALSNRDASPAELYEYELILMRKQALRLPRNDQPRKIAPGGEATFEFEILGKPGLTSATVQIDYTYLSVPRDEVTDQFYTRQLSVDLTVTVNASVELARIDALPLQGAVPQPLLDRLGATNTSDDDGFCLLSLDLRNAWPSQMAIRLEGGDGMVIEEDILPGNTSRVVIPVKRVYLEDPHAAIPSLNPSQKRQFVVSSSKISPEMERANREAFWYREKVLDSLKATWRTTTVPKRAGVLELRNIRLSPRMIEAIKVDEVGIDISVEDGDGTQLPESNVTSVDEFMRMKVHITNKTARPLVPLVRVMPALSHRPLNVALDYSRKLAWNGTLQQLLPELKGHGSVDFSIGVTALCRGEFEVMASVEEVQRWEEPGKEKDEEAAGRARSDTRSTMDLALGMKERRVWHTRRPCILTVKDRHV